MASKYPKIVGEGRVVWQGPYPNKIVTAQDFAFPDEHKETFYMWGNAANKPVIVLPVTENGNVIVTHQWRPGSDGPVYELAGGHREQGQTMEEALAAELRQEVGYESARVIPLPEFWLDAPSNRVIIAGYLALGCKKVCEPKPERSEVIEKVEMSLGEWFLRCTEYASVNNKDAKTLAVMTVALPRLVEAGFVTFLLNV